MGVAINVIVHAPTSRDGRELLRQKAAEIHAAAVLSKIEKLPCPKEQKLKLLEEVKQAISSHSI